MKSTKGKKYSEWTTEEKAANRAKRKAILEKRKAETLANFEKLEKELVALKADAKVMDLLKSVKQGAGLEKSSRRMGNRESYLVQLFGTETPEIGTKVTYLFVGIRGPEGERINEGETLGEFVKRTGDADYKYDANSIASVVWYMRKKGYILENDRNAATIIYKGFEAVAEPEVKAKVEKKTK